MSGTSLELLEADMFLYMRQMNDLKMLLGTKVSKPMRQAYLNLMGKDNVENPTNLSGQVLTQDDLEQSREDPFWHAPINVYHGALFTYFGDHEQQVDMLVRDGHRYVAKTQCAAPHVMVNTYLKGVSCFALARKTGKRKFAKMGQKCRADVKTWLDKGNPNVKHQESLLDAELLAYNGRKFAAIKQYEAAILLAARGGYQQDAALACERLGEFQLQVMNDHDEARYRLEEAIKYWKSWGALAKVNQLHNKYDELLSSSQPLEIVALNIN